MSEKPVVWDIGAKYFRVGYNDWYDCVENCIAESRGHSSLSSLRFIPRHSEKKSKLVETELKYNRPLERGCLTQPDLQAEVVDNWLQGFNKRSMKDKKDGGQSFFKQKKLLVTEKLLIPKTCQDYLTEVIFEKYDFEERIREPSQVLTACADQYGGDGKMVKLENNSDIDPLNRSVLVVDVGYSFTEVSAVFEERCINTKTIKRSTIGGKLLANLYRDRLSYHTVDVSKQPFLVEDMKETMFYVSLDPHINKLHTMLAERADPPSIKYLLPDYVNRFTGKVVLETNLSQTEAPPKETFSDYCIEVGSDRFMIPESYFSPEIVGLQEKGLVEIIKEVISLCPAVLQRYLRGNVVLTGGNACLKNLQERLQRELGSAYVARTVDLSLASSQLRCIRPLKAQGSGLNPSLAPLVGGMLGYDYEQRSLLSRAQKSSDHHLTRQDYLENGHRGSAVKLEHG